MVTMSGREVLRAIADGAEPSEFEWSDPAESLDWFCVIAGGWTVNQMASTNALFRRKPKTRVVNGFTVPTPETKAPPSGMDYFMPNLFDGAWHDELSSWDNTDAEFRWLRRGLVFLDRGAAIANAKAMCGISPDKE